MYQKHDIIVRILLSRVSNTMHCISIAIILDTISTVCLTVSFTSQLIIIRYVATYVVVWDTVLSGCLPGFDELNLALYDAWNHVL